MRTALLKCLLFPHGLDHRLCCLVINGEGPSTKTGEFSHWIQDVESILVYRWSSVVDGEPTLDQNWFNVLCLLGWWAQGYLSKDKALNQCCFNVGPVSQTIGQHWNKIGSTPYVHLRWPSIETTLVQALCLLGYNFISLWKVTKNTKLYVIIKIYTYILYYTSLTNMLLT